MTLIDYRFTDTNTGYSVDIEDDGRVAYAYLLNREGEITADVWLYNRCATPDAPEWVDPQKAPFANPLAYALDVPDFDGIDRMEEVEVRWKMKGGATEAKIVVRGELFAILEERVKPGWCRMAKKDGPLAKVLTTESE